jgi:hypothetical protein
MYGSATVAAAVAAAVVVAVTAAVVAVVAVQLNSAIFWPATDASIHAAVAAAAALPRYMYSTVATSALCCAVVLA